MLDWNSFELGGNSGPRWCVVQVDGIFLGGRPEFVDDEAMGAEW